MITKQTYVKIVCALKEIDQFATKLSEVMGVSDTALDEPVSQILNALCDEIGDIEPEDNDDIDWRPELCKYLWEDDYELSAQSMYNKVITKEC